jgi:adenylosuccinate synthase
VTEAIVIVGLGFGDEGKGSIVDFLCRTRRVHTVVRHNGGAQAAHNVVTAGGVHHEFHQFGSGMLVPEVSTHLSRFMLVDPLAMMREEEALRKIGVLDAFPRTTIDPDAVIVTPFHRAANRLKEMSRGEGRHGSCGRGIGEARADQLAGHVVTAKMLSDPKLKWRLREVQRRKLEEITTSRIVVDDEEMKALEDPEWCAVTANLYKVFSDRVQLARPRFAGTVLFEGAQGVLIDETHGFAPYNTWTNTTAENALTLLREQSFTGRVVKLGVTRTYLVRHGPGPFPTEDKDLNLPDGHNAYNDWQRDVRVGWPDRVMLDHAIYATGGVDAIALTHMDRWVGLSHWQICVGYQDPDLVMDSTDSLMTAVPCYDEHKHAGQIITEMETYAPVKITSFGPTADSKCYRSKW